MTPAVPDSAPALELNAMRPTVWRRAALLAVCALPLLVSLPTLGDKFVIAEDAANAAIWGLGARNLLEQGWVEGLRGARVAPDPGAMGNGVYAHHPPLAVWVMTVPVALGGWEGFPRLLALLCGAATLALLFRVLGRFFTPDVALAAVAALAASGFLLHSARMLTTLTLAAPLFVALLDAGLTWRETGKLPRWASPVAALLMLSAWDGFIGAGALFLGALVSARGRPWKQLLAPLGCAAAAAAFVGWHLVDATGGTAELAWQAAWRSSAPVGAGEWARYQFNALLPRLGPLTLVALLLAPLVLRRGAPAGALATMAIAAVPGVLMPLVFRQGAFKHPFWAYQLVLPAGFALAMALQSFGPRARRLAFAALAAQGLGLAVWSAQLLREEQRSADAAALLVRHFTGAREVPMFTGGRFHPWVPWNVGVTNVHLADVASLRERLSTREDSLVMIDARLTAKLKCSLVETAERSADGRWSVAPASVLLRSCGG